MIALSGAWVWIAAGAGVIGGVIGATAAAVAAWLIHELAAVNV